MTGWAGFLELATLAALLAAALTAAASAALWPWLRGRLARVHPEAAARRLWLLAAAPGFVPALALALLLLPGLLGADHCPAHREHAHLCLRHLAAAHGGLASGLVAASGAALALGLLAGGVRLARARRAIATLRRGARPGPSADVERLATDAPFSLTLGALRPRIVISEGLLRALAPAPLAVVLEHERAHARRLDALRALSARALSWAHLPAVRRELLAALSLASERACDEAAAAGVGDRLLVAETILAVARLARGAVPAGPAGLATSFAEGGAPARIEGLLAEPPAPPAGRAGWWGAALVGAALAAAEPLHHATEHLLGALLGGL
jgi:Zn-dependent protease with chaperone function